MADLLRFSVPGKPEYVGVVRLAISSAANTAGFDLEDIEDIKIAVSEVCTHVFCSCGNVATYEVSCEVGENGIVISIDDGIDKADDQNIDKLTETDYLQDCIDSLPDRLQQMNDFPDLFDPSTSILMLRALMDEVDIFSDRRNRENMLIRMIKHY